jgi:hypothetical protein
MNTEEIERAKKIFEANLIYIGTYKNEPTRQTDVNFRKKENDELIKRFKNL